LKIAGISELLVMEVLMVNFQVLAWVVNPIKVACRRDALESSFGSLLAVLTAHFP
jgi:hypothetical protein